MVLSYLMEIGLGLFAVTVTVAFNINACFDLAHVYIII